MNITPISIQTPINFNGNLEETAKRLAQKGKAYADNTQVKSWIREHSVEDFAQYKSTIAQEDKNKSEKEKLQLEQEKTNNALQNAISNLSLEQQKALLKQIKSK